MPIHHRFQFGGSVSAVTIQETFSHCYIDELRTDRAGAILFVCDENSLPLVREAGNSQDVLLLVLPPGEEHKNWPAVETILRAAHARGLGRDGLFVGLGGGVICDCTAFAASIYMRGTALALVPTTLLCMVDASLGGKTGFDLEGIKNLAGTFYPAGMILIAAEALKTLPRREWKSGMAEVIKTAILDRNPVFFEALGKTAVFPGQPDMGELRDWISGTTESPPADHFYKQILPFIEQAVLVKGRIVAEDPREDSSFPQEQPDTPGGRALLNLGHTFGHALESALGLGTISHGEAVAWGMARSCELGKKLGITPPDRAAAILQTLKAWGFTTAVSGFSVAGKTDAALGRKFQDALFSDKKKQGGKLRFVVPRTEGAVLVQQNDQVTAYLDSLYAEL